MILKRKLWVCCYLSRVGQGHTRVLHTWKNCLSAALQQHRSTAQQRLLLPLPMMHVHRCCWCNIMQPYLNMHNLSVPADHTITVAPSPQLLPASTGSAAAAAAADCCCTSSTTALAAAAAAASAAGSVAAAAATGSAAAAAASTGWNFGLPARKMQYVSLQQKHKQQQDKCHVTSRKSHG
jgi:hypothetical protein